MRLIGRLCGIFSRRAFLWVNYARQPETTERQNLRFFVFHLDWIRK